MSGYIAFFNLFKLLHHYSGQHFLINIVFEMSISEKKSNAVRLVSEFRSIYFLKWFS